MAAAFGSSPARRRFPLALAAVLASATLPVAGQVIPSFPGAEGSGSNALGGRGGDVYVVTSLADTNTAGTLRFGVSNAPAAGRTIVFRTGGTIYLQSDLNITKPNITIAGQTAPGDGITLAWRRLRITNTSNVVVRHVRARVSNYVTQNVDATFQPDSVWVSGSNNVVLDHVSASWSVDEVLSVTDSSNVTVQWSTITEALNNAGHSSGAHSYGSLVSGNGISYHHNLYAHNNSRNPRPQVLNSGTTNLDFRNNVLFNWGDQAGYSGDEAGTLNMNYVGNYFVAGPSTPSSKVSRAFLFGLTPTNAHQSGNKIDSNKNLLRDGTNTGTNMFSGSPTAWSSTPVGNPGYVTTQTADDAYASVLAHGGARPTNRDAIDTRIFGDVANMTGSIIDSYLAVGGYPTLAAGTAPTDTDNDGMPDAWETALGLNPSVANHNADFDSDGYTDLEEYLNELAAWPASAPAVFNVATTGRYALANNWNTRWQPSRFDTVQINTGTATVDAVGQDAGAVQIGALAAAGATPTLSITAGHLRVSGDVSVGHAAGTAALLSLTGGKLTVAGRLTGGISTGTFAFTGGTLVAATIDATNLRAATSAPVGTFRQNGASAVLAPGDVGTAGRTSITGSYTLTAGTVSIELGGITAASSFQVSTPAFDNLAVGGAITLDGGALSLSRLGGYDPAMGASHPVLIGSSLAGRFATVAGHQIATGKWLAVTYTPTSVLVTAAIPGDLDLSGAVDFTDLFFTAVAFGTSSGGRWAIGDFTGDGAVNSADQTVLSQFYISPTGDSFADDWARAQRIIGVVPEPGSAVPLLSGIVLLRRVRRVK